MYFANTYSTRGVAGCGYANITVADNGWWTRTPDGKLDVIRYFLLTY